MLCAPGSHDFHEHFASRGNKFDGILNENHSVSPTPSENDFLNSVKLFTGLFRPHEKHGFRHATNCR